MSVTKWAYQTEKVAKVMSESQLERIQMVVSKMIGRRGGGSATIF
jgi:hypothetical protein